jgi:hypothetical protein
MHKALKNIGEELFDGNYLTNVLYFRVDKQGRKRAIGDIDVYGFKDGSLWLIEHKNRDVKRYRNKAMNQLAKAEKYGVPIGVDYVLAYAYGNYTVEIIKEVKQVPLPRIEVSNLSGLLEELGQEMALEQYA